MEAGIRNRVEIWADGGYRHAHDIVKLHCLGANRVGFGTLAMVSLGCTICRGCQLDTCHVGIATQIEAKEEAELKGLKKFTPQEFERAAENCARFFAAMGEEVRRAHGRARLRARPGPGRALRPARAGAGHADRVDLHELIQPARRHARPRAARPAAAPTDEREAAGLIAARPDPDAREAGLARLAALAGRSLEPGVRRTGTTGRRRPRARHRSWPGELARMRICGDGPPATDDTLADLHFNGGLDRRPGPRRLQRLRRGHHGGGRRAGRRGQDDARRQGRR